MLVEEDDVLIFRDTTVHIEQDTMITVPDSIDYVIRQNESVKTKRFYDSLQAKFYKYEVTKGIYDLLFTGRDYTPEKELENGQNSESPYLKYEGRIIGNIYIHRLDPFGTDVDDTTVHADVWIVRTGNSFHIKTHEAVIRKGLLIEKGDIVDPFELADNERLLRNLPYLKDARIHIVPRKGGGDTVDISVTTKDIWTINAGVNLRGFIEGSVAIDDRNILGFGHELDNEVVYSPDEPQTWGYEGTYRIPNIKGTFITGEVTYANTFENEGFDLNIYRNFITPEMEYAGGVNLGNVRTVYDRRFEGDSIVFDYPVKFNYQDLWFGRSFKIREHIDVLKRSNIVVAGRVSRTRYVQRPLVEADTNRNYHHTTLALASIGYSTRKYYKARFINSFGRTEDIPVGSSVELTAGKEFGEFNNRFYSGIRLSRGSYDRDRGYFSGSLEFGGFFRSSRFEQGVLRVGGNYFSNLMHFNRYAVRQFIRAGYTAGIRRFADETVNINKENGIRGLNSDLLRGSRKLVLNMETVLFTPFNPLGFRIALFGFADLGLISMDGSVFSGDFYSGFGMGVRIRNDNLIFNTFQVRAGFYPLVPPDEPHFDFNVSGESVLRLRDFNLTRPDAIRLDNDIVTWP